MRLNRVRVTTQPSLGYDSQGEDAVGPWALLTSVAGLVGKQGQSGPVPVSPDAAEVAGKVADVARTKEARREEERQAEEELRAAGEEGKVLG